MGPQGPLEFIGQGWFSSSIGLAGLVIGFILYAKARVRPVLAYQRRDILLIGGNQRMLPDEVQISFRGAPVPHLAGTYMVIWNAGGNSIRGSDIVNSDPLRFVFPAEVQVLRVRVLSTTRDVIDFRAVPSDTQHSEILWTFDFLDPGDGAAVELLHTGRRGDSEVRGTIRGLPKGLTSRGRILPEKTPITGRSRLARQPRAALVIVIGLIISMVGAWGWIGEALLHTYDGATKWPLVVVGVVVYAAPGVAFLLANRRRFPRALLVDELR